MKKCAYCGRKNRDSATHCEECGWKLPERDAASRVGPRLQHVAFGILVVSLLQYVALTSGGDSGTPNEWLMGRSLLWLLIGIATAATLYWIGDYLKRE